MFSVRYIEFTKKIRGASHEPSNLKVVFRIMQKLILFLFLSLSYSGVAQTQVLLIGNSEKICPAFIDSIQYVQLDSLPEELSSYKAVFIFSNAQSVLTKTDQENMISHLEAGNGIYVGCENWPLQAEANQITNKLLGKEFWGNNTEENALVCHKEQSLFENKKMIRAGNSSVQFPLDYRLKTEAWIDDEPLILSSRTFGGGLILDGGYSRFYCNEQGQSDDVWKMILNYLLEK